MHPLFIAHVIADFLLQPTWLVRLKENKTAGIIIHAGIHALVLGLFLIPKHFATVIIIAAIAASHGIIDAAKIRYQKTHPSFAPSFLVDQLAHLSILAIAAKLIPVPEFWLSEGGIGILALLFFFSFGSALLNLQSKPSLGLGPEIKRSLLVTLVFLLFFIPSLLLASSACFAL